MRFYFEYLLIGPKRFLKNDRIEAPSYPMVKSIDSKLINSLFQEEFTRIGNGLATRFENWVATHFGDRVATQFGGHPLW